MNVPNPRSCGTRRVPGPPIVELPILHQGPRIIPVVTLKEGRGQLMIMMHILTIHLALSPITMYTI